ncbi:MAG: WbqC family protein, partial [Candidatus Eremiobacteraeota bacterium]|nr:WbqC family protein [Candidatus Eremiobacteraeota bacterium]
FEAANLGLQIQSFEHPRYHQIGSGEFVAGLSILDCLFHCGLDETRRLVKA